MVSTPKGWFEMTKLEMLIENTEDEILMVEEGLARGTRDVERYLGMLKAGVYLPDNMLSLSRDAAELATLSQRLQELRMKKKMLEVLKSKEN